MLLPDSGSFILRRKALKRGSSAMLLNRCSPRISYRKPAMNTPVRHHRIVAVFLGLMGSLLWIVGFASDVLPVCQLIATGGTIAMKIDPVKNAPVPALSGEDLVASVPELATVAIIRVESPFNIPSGDMDPDKWVTVQRLVVKALASEEVAGAIVSHGTDTLEETGYFLDLTVSGDKPIVLVGAQRNASERDFDGPRNLVNAARVCVPDTPRLRSPDPDARGDEPRRRRWQ